MTTAESNADPPPPRQRSMLVKALIAVWLIAPWSLVALMAWTDRPHGLDLLSHFLAHAAAVVVIVGLGCTLLRRFVSAANLGLVALAIMLGWSFWADAPAGAPVPGARVLTLVQFNMQGESSRHDNDAAAWLRDQQADVIVLIEPPFGLLNDYPFLRERYPFVVEPQPGLMWEVMLLSRFPAEVRPITEYSEETKFSFAARRSLLVNPPDGVPFLLSAMHPPSPRTRETWMKSLEGVRLNGRLLREFHERTSIPIIVAGDFNSTPFGRVHREFAQGSGFTAWATLFNGGTWPARLPRWLAIQIDRVWTTPGVSVHTMSVGPAFRSDHRPIVSRIALPALPAQNPANDRQREPVGQSAR